MTVLTCIEQNSSIMTIQKTEILFKGKVYDVILEDGIVAYCDSLFPNKMMPVAQPADLKVTSIETAKKRVLQMLELMPSPLMTFSD